MGVSAPSLHIESTDSMIVPEFCVRYNVCMFSRLCIHSAWDPSNKISLNEYISMNGKPIASP